MIVQLSGIAQKGKPGTVMLNVHGVGYGLAMPISEWDVVKNGEETVLHVTTYVREDRIALFGFTEESTKTLFEAFIELSGVGPRMALELCAVPRSLLASAIREKDANLLTSIKGIGRKSAEKLLVELSNLTEREPHILADASGTSHPLYDRDAADALVQLGFETADVLRVLQELPPDLHTTEQRVAGALRSL